MSMTEKDLLYLEPLEQRVLLSLVPDHILPIFDPEWANGGHFLPNHDNLSDDNILMDGPLLDQSDIVFIDKNIEDYGTILKGVADDTAFFTLDPNLDGIKQISNILANKADLTSIHIISHGSEGQISLGNAVISTETMSEYHQELEIIGQSLSEAGDILLYGCSVSGGPKGKIFIENLSQYTSADIAASTDMTGHAEAGGNWTLEHHAGIIESTPVISLEARSAWAGTLDTYTVTNTNDAGAGSLRQAIIDANAINGMDTITFDIAGGGPHTITPLSELPYITDPVTIDGTSESDWAASAPVIELDGSDLAGVEKGLYLDTGSNGSVIRGLVCHSFPNQFLLIKSTNNTITGNFIGTDPTGTLNQGNGNHAIWLQAGANNNIIGGTTLAERNIISGTENGTGILINNAHDNIIQGNYIGTNITGTATINNVTGIHIRGGATGNIIGGSDPKEGNLISGNDNIGIQFSDNDTSGNIIQGNMVGTQADGVSPLGNKYGISFNNQTISNNCIGGVNPGEGNIIAHNQEEGIILKDQAGSGNSILGNLIFSNGDRAINLDTNNSVQANDPDDADVGPNDYQNYPVITATVFDDGKVYITGTLDSTPDTTFRIEFFSGATPHDSSHGDAEAFLGAMTVTTDANGDVLFSETLTAVMNAGDFITATATVELGGNNFGSTSEMAMNDLVLFRPTTTGIADVLVIENADDTIINLYPSFADVEDADEDMTYTIVNNTNPDLFADIGIVDGELRLSYAADQFGDATITIRATDTDGLLKETNLTVTVDAVNDAPIGLGLDNIVVNEDADDTVIHLHPSFGDIEDNDEEMTYTIENNTNAALFDSVNIIADHLTLAYAADQYGTATITIRATDTGGIWVEETMLITVNAVNDPPTSSGIDDINVNDNAGDKVINLYESFDDIEDTDADLVYTITDNSNSELFSGVNIAAGTLTLDYAANQSGSAAITVRATDTGGLWAEETFDVNITAVNDAPVSLGISNITVMEDAPDTLINLFNAFDDEEEGSDLTYSISDNTNSGLFTNTEIANGILTLNYAPNHSGFAVIIVRATDSGGLWAEERFVVTVTAGNDKPISFPDRYVTAVNTTLSTAAAQGVLENDFDYDQDTLTAQLASDVAHGTLTFNSDGTFEYIPETGWQGTDSFTYTAFDGTAYSKISTVTLYVVPDEISHTINEDTVLNVESQAGLLAFTSDYQEEDFTALLHDDADHGALTLNEDGSYIYTPDPDWYGQDSFTAQVISESLNAVMVTVRLTVLPVNDLHQGSSHSYEIEEDTVLNIEGSLGLLAHLSDPEGDPLTIILEKQSSHGTLMLNSDGTFSYIPDADWYGQDSFQYRITDGIETGSLHTITLNVLPVNDAPVMERPNNQSVNQDSVLVFNPLHHNPVIIRDIDADANIMRMSVQASFGTISLSNLNGLAFLTGDGSEDKSMTFEGTQDALNQALDGMVYHPADDAGVDTLVMEISDNGATGSGNILTDNAVIQIIINPAVDDDSSDNDGSADGEPESPQLPDHTEPQDNGQDENDHTINDNDNQGGSIITPDDPDDNDSDLNESPGAKLDKTAEDTSDNSTDETGSEELKSAPDDAVTENSETSSDTTTRQTGESDRSQESSRAGRDNSSNSAAVRPVNDNPAPADGHRHMASLNLNNSMQVPHLRADSDGAVKAVSAQQLRISALSSMIDMDSDTMDRLGQVVQNAQTWQKTSQAADELNGNSEAKNMVRTLRSGTVAGITSSVTFGYIAWAIRTGALAASLSSSLPMWSLFDPVPVLGENQIRQSLKKDKDAGNDQDEKRVEAFLADKHNANNTRAEKREATK